jgi:hypothetical protein
VPIEKANDFTPDVLSTPSMFNVMNSSVLCIAYELVY